jgi:dynein heavy chain
VQIKVKKADNDLLIEQLRQVFRVLNADKVPVAKLDKRLDNVAHKWDDVKKLQPQVKNSVEPVQVRAVAAAAAGC